MQKRQVIRKVCGLLLLTVVIAAPVSAHHSFAGYDMTQNRTAKATIKEFRWGAPHSSAVFIIDGPDGKPQQITVASAAPTTYVKQGFKPKDFRVGDTVEVVWHPTRAGTPGGIIAMIKLPDGRTFKDTEFAAILAKEAEQNSQPAAPVPAK